MPILTQLSLSSSLPVEHTLSSATILEESIAVDAAACKAIQLINEFSNIYNNNSNNNDNNEGGNKNNKNPEEMYHSLDLARNDIMAAWNRLQQVSSQQNNNHNQQGVDTACVRNHATTSYNNDTNTSNNVSNDAIDLRPAFIDMITDAFGDVLDNLRQTEEVDVSILVDCLQSGLEIMSSDVINDDEFLWADDYDNSSVIIDDNDDDDDDIDDDNDNNNDENDDVETSNIEMDAVVDSI